jgi:hypothetical protein
MPKYQEERERPVKAPKHASLIALKRRLSEVERLKLTAPKERYMMLCEEASHIKEKLAEKPVRN